MTANAYTEYVKTVDRHAARLHEPELSTLRAAADAVFFAEEGQDEAVAEARELVERTLAHQDRLGADAAARLLVQLDAIGPRPRAALARA
jgi:hypothetical protein